MRVVDLMIEQGRDLPAKRMRFLAVANSHQGLSQLFRGTHWADRSGASGVWVQSLRRIPGAMPHAGLRFNGHYARATIVPIERVLSVEGGESTSGATHA